MKFGFSVAFVFLLVVSTVTAKGHGETRRSKRGLTIYDLVRGVTTAAPQTSKPTKGNANGLDLADALNPSPKTPKPAGGSGNSFSLDDALSPDANPSREGNGGSCQAVAQQLSKVIENQKNQFSMLERVMARLNMRPM